jgi:acetylornithine deacetylase/succinyl-diaminopimelate desuccinylase-like protein
MADAAIPASPLADGAAAALDAAWEDDVVPALTEFLRIPNLSPAFDADWERHGHMERAAALLASWVGGRDIAGMRVEVVRRPGLTPLIVAEIPAHGVADEPDDTVLVYGHLDKQPEIAGWRDGLSPWEPVREGDRLYGRGGADDGYAVFAALTAIEAVRRHGGAHRRVVVLVEASEESGSPDLPAHLEVIEERLGDVGLVVTLDSGASTWDRLWVTTSLRGLVSVDLRVDVLAEGAHSGLASGISPSSFRIARALLDRVEDATTGAILLDALHVEIPAERVEQARTAAQILGEGVYERLPLLPDASRAPGEPADALLAGTWEPTLSVVGADGLPPLPEAGNVVRPFTTLRLSFRLPPTAAAHPALAAVVTALEADQPPGSRVSVRVGDAATGWNAPATAPWLAGALDGASRRWFGRPPAFEGQGGSIPFMAMLGARFPAAQFVVTGVLGPGSNAHGPNEFLDLRYARALTGCVAEVLAAHARR